MITQNAPYRMPDVTRVRIQKILMDKIDATDLSGLSKDIVFWIIYQCQTRKDFCCPINQRVLDKIVGSRQRQKIRGFIHDSGCIRPASSGYYRPHRQCKRYELVDIERYLSEQHNNELCVNCDEWCWRSVDFNVLLCAFHDACEELGWHNSERIAALGLAGTDDVVLSDDELRNCVPGFAGNSCGDLKVLESHVAAYCRYRDRRAEGIRRIDGRVYSTATSLPREIRSKCVRFGGHAEGVDVSACYIWILAAEHRVGNLRRGKDISEVEGLLDLIEQGEFYATLANLAGIPCGTDAERQSVKRDFQTFCLFGTIGWHPLWHALMQLCPGVCADIRWWRQQFGGATRLALMLQRAEGQLTTDGLIRWLHSKDIRAVQIHDGAIVPAGCGAEAAAWLQEQSRRLYGRSCRVKTERIA